MSKIIIREMRPDDYYQIKEASLKIEEIRLADFEDKEWHSNFIKMNNELCFVATTNDEITGFVYCGSDGRKATIYHLAVLEKYRKQNIGRMLMDNVETGIKNRNITKAQLLILATNPKVVDFYEKLGWKVRDDVILMSKGIK